MSLIQKIADFIYPDNVIEGTGDNLQEALDDYSQKVKSLGPDIEITAIEVGNTDEQGVRHNWFTLKMKGY